MCFQGNIDTFDFSSLGGGERIRTRREGGGEKFWTRREGGANNFGF